MNENEISDLIVNDDKRNHLTWTFESLSFWALFEILYINNNINFMKIAFSDIYLYYTPSRMHMHTDVHGCKILSTVYACALQKATRERELNWTLAQRTSTCVQHYMQCSERWHQQCPCTGSVLWALAVVASVKRTNCIVHHSYPSLFMCTCVFVCASEASCPFLPHLHRLRY